MWSGSVYTGTLSSCLPHSMLGSKTSPSPKIKKEHAQICQVWGPTSDWVDFCPVDCSSGGMPVEGQHNINVSLNSRIKILYTFYDWNVPSVHFHLHFSCTGGRGVARFLLSHPGQVTGSSPGCSTETNMSSQTDNSESSIPLSLKVFGQWREDTAPRKLD